MVVDPHTSSRETRYDSGINVDLFSLKQKFVSQQIGRLMPMMSKQSKANLDDKDVSYRSRSGC